MGFWHRLPGPAPAASATGRGADPEHLDLHRRFPTAVTAAAAGNCSAYSSGKVIVVLSPIMSWVKRSTSSIGGPSAVNTWLSIRFSAASRNFANSGVNRWR